MSVALATVAFFVVVVGLVLLPLLPAWREIRSGVDARALHIAADGRVSPHYFADRFRTVLVDRLAGPMQEVRASAQVMSGRIDGAEDFVVLPPGHDRLEDPSSRGGLVVALGDLRLDDDQRLRQEVYVEGSLRGGDGIVLRAALVDGDLELGARATGLRWIHAGGRLVAGDGSRLHGRVSADGGIRLGVGTVFERMHAPRIEFGEPAPHVPLDPTPRAFAMDASDLEIRSEVQGHRTLAHGPVDLPEGAVWSGDLVVRGRLLLGRGARVEGSVKAERLEMGTASHVTGSVFSAGTARIGSDVTIDGLLVVERHASLGLRCIVGAAPGTTTLRAESLEIAAGCVVHGTVWTSSDGGRTIA